MNLLQIIFFILYYFFGILLYPSLNIIYPSEIIATNLKNPRGLIFLENNKFLCVEAGSGINNDNAKVFDGSISLFEDLNLDGDYDDKNEKTVLLNNFYSYNIMTHFNPGRDEVIGLSDIIFKDKNNVIYTLDNDTQHTHIIEYNLFTKKKNIYSKDQV